MPNDRRDLLEILRHELEFLKKGGYAQSCREPWRAQLFLEDSPSCMNAHRKSNPRPCTECALLRFVPPENRNEKVPCRHIPLNLYGETLFELYRGSTQQELEDTMADWLRDKIRMLEAEQKSAQNAA